MTPLEVEKGNNDVRVFDPVAPIELGNNPPMFNLQNELAKLKVLIPFNELLRNQEYRDTITKMVANQGEAHLDILEMTEDNPTFIMGSKVDTMDNDDEEVPPFYMSLNVHDMVLYNGMLDSGSSHNMMPKGVV